MRKCPNCNEKLQVLEIIKLNTTLKLECHNCNNTIKFKQLPYLLYNIFMLIMIFFVLLQYGYPDIGYLVLISLAVPFVNITLLSFLPMQSITHEL